MTGLDTNVLVRFLVEDDEDQSARAAALIERASARDERLFVSDIVVCELVWVLESAYGCQRPAIGQTLPDLVRARQLGFQSTDRRARAVRSYAEGRGDLADYLIREHAWEAGCTGVATFDRALPRDDGFTSP